MSGWLAFAGIAVGLIGAGGVASVIVKHMEIRAEERSGARENVLIDQLQEENKKLLGENAAIRERVDRLETNERTLVNYIYELYAHMAEGKPPPPPPMPDLT